jgi:hypothetical protein
MELTKTRQKGVKASCRGNIILTDLQTYIKGK